MKKAKCPNCNSKMKRVYAGNIEISHNKLIKKKTAKITKLLLRKFKKVVKAQCYQLMYQCKKKDCKFSIVARGKNYATTRAKLNKGLKKG